MKHLFYLVIVLVIGCADPRPEDQPADTAADTTSQAAQTRCGWFLNPTPGNAWLTDGDGEWTVGMQGGHQAEGDWPEFAEEEWVAVNGSYGYGCACFVATVDFGSRHVLEITSAESRPLSACRSDPALADWESQM